jgi:hypothetical protein
MHKKEALPKEKILLSTGRPIIYPPLDFYILQAMYTQELDDHLKKDVPWFFCGHTPYMGGFNKLATHLNEFRFKFKGDISKMDASIGFELFRIIAEFRKACMPRECHEYIDFIYCTLASKFVVFPDSTAVHDTRQPSGSRTTTTDDTIAHMFAILLGVLRRFQELDIPYRTDLVLQFCRFCSYADDHLAGTDDPVFASFQYREKFYADCGFTLKKDDDLVTNDVSDLTFLGGKFHLNNGFYVYAYSDMDKLVDTLYTHKYTSVADLLSSVYSRIFITVTSPNDYSKWCMLYDELRKRYAPSSPIRPATYSILSFLRGTESISHVPTFAVIF